jgi:uncharacterized protein YndB with AHSA1/START domain
MQDIITREIVIKASKERVYTAITDPKQIVNWFPDAIEGSLAVGERPILSFGEHGKNQIYVEAAQPHDYFAYRWMPGGADSLGDTLTKPNTLVEFRLTENEGRTTVTMTESGFAALPSEMAERSFNQNSGGWDYMLGRLEKQFTGA